MFERVLDTPVAVSDHSFSMHAKYSEKITLVTQQLFCASTKWMIPYLARPFFNFGEKAGNFAVLVCCAASFWYIHAQIMFSSPKIYGTVGWTKSGPPKTKASGLKFEKTKQCLENLCLRQTIQVKIRQRNPKQGSFITFWFIFTSKPKLNLYGVKIGLSWANM